MYVGISTLRSQKWDYILQDQKYLSITDTHMEVLSVVCVHQTKEMVTWTCFKINLHTILPEGCPELWMLYIEIHFMQEVKHALTAVK